MKGKKQTQGEKKSAGKKQPVSHQFETMSQKDNRTGKGRQHSGSDGTGQAGRGSNH